MVYLPMAYLYGKKFVAPLSSIVLSLRRELYTTLYNLIDWDRTLNLCAEVIPPPGRCAEKHEVEKVCDIWN